MPAILIEGYTDSDKVPGGVAINQWGAGRLSIGAIPMKCVLYGNKTSGGTAAVNSKTPITTPEEADDFFGPRSELGRMCVAALDVPGVTLEAVVVAEAAGAQATLTVTFGGSWTAGATGELTFQLDECIYRVAFDSSVTTVTLAAAAFVSKTNQQQQGRLFCSAANALGVVTLTVANIGVRGNQHTGFIVDSSKLPSGMTVALAGGTPLGNAGVPFSGGTGTDDVTAALAAYSAVQHDYEGFAQNDSTNINLVEAATNAKAAFDVGLLQQYVVTTNSTLANAIALGQTAMNDQLGFCGWAQYGVEHPSRVTARIAAIFSIIDGSDANHNYDGRVIEGGAPHYRAADSPNRSTQNAALNASITPLVTVDGELQIVRAINSHSLDGATPDYRTYDHAETTVPIRVRKELIALYAQRKLENPYAGPDPDDGQLPPEGTMTPMTWKGDINSSLKDWEGPAFNWLTEVDDNPPDTQWNSTSKRIMAVVPTIVKAQNHQAGIIVRQQAA